MPARKRPALRGSVNNIILESLLSGDKYGYEIIKIVEEKSKGKIVLKQPSLYSSLKRFEAKGFITSYWEDSDIGGKRHYYTITETGKNYYNKTVLKSDDDFDDNFEDNDDIFDLEQEPEQNSQIELKPAIELEQPESNVLATSPILERIEQLKIEITEIPSLSEQVKTEPEVEHNYVEENTKFVNEIQPSSSPMEEFEEDMEDVEEITQDLTPVTSNVDDDDYDVFALLERSATLKKIKKKQKYVNENIIQVDMFSKSTSNLSTKKEENVNVESLKSIRTPFTPQEPIRIKKDIPLIEEKEQDYFKWEEFKATHQMEQIQSVPSEKPLKNQIFMDEYGIIKIGEKAEEKQPPVKKIFDNVGARIEYHDPVMKPKPAPTPQIVELTPEQREEKNKQFNQKFDKIITEKSYEEDINYKNILGELLFKEEPKKQEIEQNRFYEETKIEQDEIENAISSINRSRRSVSDLEGDFKFKLYNAVAPEEKENKSNFILINKARFHFGLFSAILMILQINVLFVILKTLNLLTPNDYMLFVVFNAIAIAFLIVCIIPFLVASEKRAENTFRCGYTLIFGILLFLASCALTYAGCTFAGLNGQNVNLFAAKLLLPITFFINFIISPLIYKIVLQDKRLY